MNQGYSSSGRAGMTPPPGPMGGPHGGPDQYGQPMGGPSMPPSSQNVVYNQAQPQVVNVISGQTFGTKPVSITCQFCKNPVTTNVEKSCNCCSCLLCCWTGFIFWVCIQCCRNKEINCCDATHKCPQCGQILGNYTSC